jgi:hypothetical protein
MALGIRAATDVAVQYVNIALGGRMDIDWVLVQRSAAPWRIAKTGIDYVDGVRLGFFTHGPSALFVEAVAQDSDRLMTRAAAWYDHASHSERDRPGSHGVRLLLWLTGPAALLATATGNPPRWLVHPGAEQAMTYVRGKPPTRRQWTRMLRAISYCAIVPDRPASDDASLTSVRLPHLVDLTASLIREVLDADPGLSPKALLRMLLSDSIVAPSSVHDLLDLRSLDTRGSKT